ncbi:sulfotransferase family protein [Aequoribacter sp.]|uniref:sulfotransferase family protein n=1 Tax=Aequoribacter sp. TaxID=2847771 RepID=UPI003F698BEF
MSTNNPLWQAPPHPQWLSQVNDEARCFDLQAVVPLDETSLLDHAMAKTGLSDFGEDSWREPFQVYLKSVESEAQLTLFGRLMARNDLILWLTTRLEVMDWLKRYPEIEEQEVKAPMFIVGLPRSGTSILFELLAQDPDVGVPLMWEALQPCPPPEIATYGTDPRIEYADSVFTQWNRVAPEFAAMHEMRGDIPAECGLIMAGSFISDHIGSLHQTPSYAMWCAQADYLPAYKYHRKVLQVLQWRNPRARWLLKAPEHQVHLDVLLQIYPDARIVQTHRDPIQCMASTTSLMGTLYHMRSDQPFNAAMFENILMGEATAHRLEKVMDQRDSGLVPPANIADSRYQDLIEDPLANIQRLYRHFDLDLSDTAKTAMQAYLAAKPKGKFGTHRYPVQEEHLSARPLFERYQTRYQVPNET